MDPGGRERIPCRQLILAIGHSARDTFAMLEAQSIALEPKPFAMGVRIEHLQSQINDAQYGGNRPDLPPADYKLFCHLPDRTVYTFCMCPGGYVVAAASEEGGIVTNGMSYSGRSGPNANAACWSPSTPRTFPTPAPWAACAGSRSWSGRPTGPAHHYQAPASRVGDFLPGRPLPALWRCDPHLPSRGRALGPAPSPAPHPHRRPRPGTSCPGAEAVGL